MNGKVQSGQFSVICYGNGDFFFCQHLSHTVFMSLFGWRSSCCVGLFLMWFLKFIIINNDSEKNSSSTAAIHMSTIISNYKKKKPFKFVTWEGDFLFF